MTQWEMGGERGLLGAGEITRHCDARIWMVSERGNEGRDTPNHVPTPHNEKGRHQAAKLGLLCLQTPRIRDTQQQTGARSSFAPPPSCGTLETGATRCVSASLLLPPPPVPTASTLNTVLSGTRGSGGERRRWPGGTHPSWTLKARKGLGVPLKQTSLAPLLPFILLPPSSSLTKVLAGEICIYRPPPPI